MYVCMYGLWHSEKFGKPVIEQAATPSWAQGLLFACNTCVAELRVPIPLPFSYSQIFLTVYALYYQSHVFEKWKAWDSSRDPKSSWKCGGSRFWELTGLGQIWEIFRGKNTETCSSVCFLLPISCILTS